MFSSEDRGALFTVSCIKTYSVDKEIKCVDEHAQPCFYIILDGMVREYEKNGATELTRAFYCEDDYFGWDMERANRRSCFYQAMETVVLCCIQRERWLSLQTQYPLLEQMWYTMIDKRKNGIVEWNEIFHGMHASDMLKLLFNYKPALWRNTRLHRVFTCLYGNALHDM